MQVDLFGKPIVNPVSDRRYERMLNKPSKQIILAFTLVHNADGSMILRGGL